MGLEFGKHGVFTRKAVFDKGMLLNCSLGTVGSSVLEAD